MKTYNGVQKTDSVEKELFSPLESTGKKTAHRCNYQISTFLMKTSLKPSRKELER